jgi:2-succinyl-5-enolpyruvyl-6-hydroxy-3-cyclohexene-1-carboxylate synthase
LILAGPMPPRQGVGEAIRELARVTGYPLLADAASNARFPMAGGGNEPLIVAGAEAILRAEWETRREPDLVIRFGASPVWRPVNAYLAGAPQVITVDPHGSWDDPDRRATERIAADAGSVARQLAMALGAGGSDQRRSAWCEEWKLADGAAADAAVASSSAAEAGSGSGSGTSLWVVPALLGALPDRSQLWAANSMSVRELDSFGRSDSRVSVLTNRGAAGIDGTISAAFGAARATGAPTVLLTGDLAFWHDLNGLLAAGEAHAPVVIVVLNDGGGGIFGYLDAAAEPEFERVFRTPQPADLRASSRALGASHMEARTPAGLAEAVGCGLGASGVTVIEVPLDFEANKAAHRDYWAAVRARLEQV